MSNSISLFDLAFKPASLPLRKDQRSEKSNEGYSKTAFFVHQVSSYQVFLWQFKIGSSFSSDHDLSNVNVK